MTQEQELTLTTEQWTKVLKIQDDMVDSIKGNVKATVRTACELMNNEGIPKEKICYLVCQRHGDLGYSEDYLRTFVPVEYKNQAQRDIRLTHEGRDNLDQHETTTVEIHSDKDIQPINDLTSTSAATPKKIGSLTQKYKSELDKLRFEYIQYRNQHEYTFIYKCIKDGMPELELGQKVKEHFSNNKWYLKWLKEDKKYEASLNVKGKTREEAYIDNQNKMVEEQDRQEAAAIEKKSRSKSRSKSKSVEPKDISKRILKEEKK